MENMIDVRGLHVALDRKTIVQDINLAIPKAKITAIIGPNGCGKSTTLKAICRINPISAGEIRLLGKDVRAYSYREFARKLALLTQSPVAPPDMTVRDLVAMGRFPYRRLFGGTSQEDRDCIEWALKEANLTEYRFRTLQTLSGGERQRAWIAMSLAQKPQVLLLDEPTTYLDISHQLEVMKLLQKLNEELGLTVVLVLHDLNQAIQFAHHVAVMKQGRMVADGTPAQVIDIDLLQEVFRVRAENAITSGGIRTLVPLDLL